MHDSTMRWTAFAAVILALLNAGYHFQRGDPVATMYFMAAAILLCVVSDICARRRLI